MATTTNLQLTLLEIGHKEKELIINSNMAKIDSNVLRYLGELASDPLTNPIPGSTYYNTTTSKLRVFKSELLWDDVDKSSAGPKGDKGDTGDTGATGGLGLKGDKGDTGDTGAQGLQGETGPQGPKGDKGDKGDAGPKGDAGDTGAQGLQGETGPQGLQGAQGVQGNVGSQGPQGIQGEYPTSTGTITITDELILGNALKLGQGTTGIRGWTDLTADIVVKDTAGSNNPTWEVFRDGLSGYMFSPTSMTQVWANFHVTHNIALGTVLYPHVHWSPITTGTGTVRWGFEYSVAKGHQQASGSVFPTTTTVYVEQNIATASQYKHFIAEVAQGDAVPSTNIEPDSFILMRIFRDSAHANDTYAGKVHAWAVDIHHQIETLATKNKAPNFYS